MLADEIKTPSFAFYRPSDNVLKRPVMVDKIEDCCGKILKMSALVPDIRNRLEENFGQNHSRPNISEHSSPIELFDEFTE